MAKRRYKFVRTSNLAELWDEVNDAISEGWEPLGGITQVVEEGSRIAKGYKVGVNDDNRLKWLQSLHLERSRDQRMKWMQTLWLPPEKKTSWWRK